MERRGRIVHPSWMRRQPRRVRFGSADAFRTAGLPLPYHAHMQSLVPPEPSNPRRSKQKFIAGLVVGALSAGVPATLIGTLTGMAAGNNGWVSVVIELLLACGLALFATRPGRGEFLKGLLISAAFVCLALAALYAFAGTFMNLENI